MYLQGFLLPFFFFQNWEHINLNSFHDPFLCHKLCCVDRIFGGWVALPVRNYRLFLLCSSSFFTRLPSVCPEVPAAAGPPVLSGTCLSMDGHHHKNEESWHDGCRECYCHSGREMCALITCPVPACGNPTIHPGQCCPSCSGKSWPPSRVLPKQMTFASSHL